MTKQNRVDPWGQLKAIKVKGFWLGNRGILHNKDQEIVVPWRHKSWVTCQLHYQGRNREIFSDNNYSELFFLDEATALSAGHRPCAECRRERYNEFKGLWCAANLGGAASSSVPISQIDNQLHSERAKCGGGKITYHSELQAIAPGAFVVIGNDAYLYWGGRLQKWSPTGYSKAKVKATPSMVVEVLTPASIVKIMKTGFIPQVHESAFN